jgi:hypothetical protein
MPHLGSFKDRRQLHQVGQHVNKRARGVLPAFPIRCALHRNKNRCCPGCTEQQRWDDCPYAHLFCSKMNKTLRIAVFILINCFSVSFNIIALLPSF